MTTKLTSKTKRTSTASSSTTIKQKAIDSDAASILSISSDDGDESEFEADSALEAEEDQVEGEDDDEEIEIIELESDVDSDDLDNDDPKGKKKVVVKKRKSSPKGNGEGSNKKAKVEVKVEGGKNTRVVKKIVKLAKPSENAETSVILPTTMDFLRRLGENNTREFFWDHEPLYRHALVNWNTFITALVPRATDSDWTLPPMPYKDLVHRIARDVRFSNNKIPYKTNLSASLSRTGRKGPWALYYIAIQPGDRSMIAGGAWSPSSGELSAIRHSILANPKPLRDAISAPEFLKLFGEPVHKGAGVRSSIFGQDDELKSCPKLAGVTKAHPDIDLLKLRSIAVSTRFTDAEVLSDNFLDIVIKKMDVLAPFVQCINEMISPSHQDDDDEEEEEEE